MFKMLVYDLWTFFCTFGNRRMRDATFSQRCSSFAVVRELHLVGLTRKRRVFSCGYLSTVTIYVRHSTVETIDGYTSRLHLTVTIWRGRTIEGTASGAISINGRELFFGTGSGWVLRLVVVFDCYTWPVHLTATWPLRLTVALDRSTWPLYLICYTWQLHLTVSWPLQLTAAVNRFTWPLYLTYELDGYTWRFHLTVTFDRYHEPL